MVINLIHYLVSYLVDYMDHQMALHLDGCLVYSLEIFAQAIYICATPREKIQDPYKILQMLVRRTIWFKMVHIYNYILLLCVLTVCHLLVGLISMWYVIDINTFGDFEKIINCGMFEPKKWWLLLSVYGRLGFEMLKPITWALDSLLTHYNRR